MTLNKFKSSQLFVTDLDGTLLTPDSRLAPSDRKELNRLIDKGLPLTIATARSWYSAKELLEGLHLTLPVITFDGASAVNPEDGSNLFRKLLPGNIARELMETGEKALVPPFVSCVHSGSESLWHLPGGNEGMDWYRENRTRAGDRRLREAKSLANIPDDEIVCLIYIAEKNEIDRLHDSIRHRFGNELSIYLTEHIYQKGWFWLRVSHRDSTKANGLRWLAELTGIPLSSMTVFGDQYNDLSMFKVAHRAIAVANADEDVLKAADRVILPNSKNGVTRFLTENWLAGKLSANGSGVKNLRNHQYRS